MQGLLLESSGISSSSTEHDLTNAISTFVCRLWQDRTEVAVFTITIVHWHRDLCGSVQWKLERRGGTRRFRLRL